MYKPLPDGLTIKKSDVQGLGLFATKDFEAEVVLGIVPHLGQSTQICQAEGCPGAPVRKAAASDGKPAPHAPEDRRCARRRHMQQ